MTDLERAQEVFDAMCEDPEIWATHGMPQTYKERLIVRRFADALAAARREGAEQARRRLLYDEEGAIESAYRRGAEEMRERAAQTADEVGTTRAADSVTANYIVAAIRALPLTPEEPA